MREYIIPYPDDITPEMVRELYKEERELIRCKDCKHFDGIDCKINDIVNIMNTDWFCADGEKEEKV